LAQYRRLAEVIKSGSRRSAIAGLLPISLAQIQKIADFEFSAFSLAINPESRCPGNFRSLLSMSRPVFSWIVSKMQLVLNGRLLT
jgi:hypothetical protein